MRTFRDMSTSGKVILGIAALVAIGIMGGGQGGHSGMVSPTSPEYHAQTSAPEPQTDTERVEAAVRREASCSPKVVNYVGSDKTGTLYMVGCGSGIYSALIGGPEGKISEGTIKVSYITKWNGIN
jgi:hypothetical protein